MDKPKRFPIGSAKGLAEARDRIAEAKRTGAEELDIGGLELTEIPEELLELHQLKVLYLGFSKAVAERQSSRRTEEDKKLCNAVRALPPALFASLLHLAKLNLEHNRLIGLPDTIKQLTGLTWLNLSGNNIGDDGARVLGQLSGLTWLSLSGNNIGADGARALGQLSGLTSLSLNGNNIGADGARVLGQLTGLTWLNLSGNNIGDDGARVLGQLSGLTWLNLSGNNIGDDGARALGQLSGLTSLNLSGNNIGDDGARALGQLSGLAWLDVGGNNIGDDGARALGQLSGLTWLDLRGNSFFGAVDNSPETHGLSLDDYLDACLGGASIHSDGLNEFLDAWADRSKSRLKRLFLDASALNLPQEIIESGDAEAIFAAWRAFRRAERQQQLRPLNEAKMLVVGHEAVGKTSLIKYLAYNKPRDPDEQKTSIEIHGWSPEGTDGIKLNVWDFGGQEMMYGTHRYFLTARSLYLLVLQNRTEDDKSIYDWLRTIRGRGGKAPVIVVINKCDNGKEALRLDETGLKRDYPNIARFLRTSCNDDAWSAESINALRQGIVEVLKGHDELADIRQEVPAAWLWVKESIATKAQKEHVLGFADFVLLCDKARQVEGTSPEDLQSQHEQRSLLRLLHDLGTLVAHGISADDLTIKRDIALLDPNWLTRAIYTILTEPRLLKQNGIFRRAQLHEWLDSGDYPLARHEFILDMMCDKDIGLCAELAGTSGEGFLVPEALPVNEPDYDRIWPEQSLRFRYRYEQLPSGLIPRFLVEAHKRLTGKPTLWRTGAVFEAANCRVLVRGDINKDIIDIAVCGTAALQRSALHIILEDMERVHGTYRELLFKRRVPLPDKPDVDESFEHLLRLEAKYGPDYSYEPADGDREYTVGKLLNGVPRHAGHFDGKEERIRPVSGMSAQKLRVLFLAANPTDTTKLRLDEELREVREELALSNMRDRFDLQNRGAVRPKDFVRAILSLRPAYIHFSGHGAKNGSICMENQDGKALEVAPEALKALFDAASEDVRCVLLNACYSEKQAQAIVAHVPYVIGMNTAIGDKAAIAFAMGFYRAIGDGRDVPNAFKLGLVELKMYSIPEDTTPVLLTKGTAGSA